MNNEAIRVAIIGMGGFAGDHHRSIHALEQQGLCHLVCTCDPDPSAFAEARKRLEFSNRGVEVFTDYRDMLDRHQGGLDLVTIPTPVPLHAPMHRAAIEHGLACYLEKPPTLNVDELDEMLAVEAQAPKQTQVGFNFIVEPERQALKARIVKREFGPIRGVSFLGMAPRATTYFNRAAWPGRLIMDGRLVLDSVIGNAVSHWLHNLLFWAGRDEVLSWEGVTSMRAELYRAHAIEGTDSFFAMGTCANGVQVQVAATHACEGEHLTREQIDCERATIRRVNTGPYEIEWSDGKRESIAVPQRDLLVDNFAEYIRYLRGDVSRPISRLADTRPFVEYYDLAYVAAKQITAVDEEMKIRTATKDGKGEFVAIRDIRQACETFMAVEQFPSEQRVAWGRPGGKAQIQEIGKLRAVVDAMA